jgi:hypothetical protein
VAHCHNASYKQLQMNVMKTKIILLSLLFLCALSCRKPLLPKPGEPTLKVSRSEKPALKLPWGVVKGTRLACSAHFHFTPDQSPIP